MQKYHRSLDFVWDSWQDYDITFAPRFATRSAVDGHLSACIYYYVLDSGLRYQIEKGVGIYSRPLFIFRRDRFWWKV